MPPEQPQRMLYASRTYVPAAHGTFCAGVAHTDPASHGSCVWAICGLWLNSVRWHYMHRRATATATATVRVLAAAPSPHLPAG